MLKFGLTNGVIEVLRNYFNSIDELSQVKIFGSRATNTFNNGSDIDFALFSKTGVSLDLMLISKIKIELDELMTPYYFDVVDYFALENQDLICHIDTHGVVFD
ncbi:MAG: nucleotidyltransferase domain-containing protein [Candidatus Gastranaerophilales bacterium]